MRTPGATLDADELERELGATDELVLGTELDVVTTLELLGAIEERELGATELDGTTGELLGATDERELGANELVVATDELERGITLLDEPPTKLVHVERAIQLLLFSQPQPLCELTHTGNSVPYQLHCCPLGLDRLELTLELLTTGVELRDEPAFGIDDPVVDPEQILPVRVGISAFPPRLST
jgi:hypothetical protein